MASLVEACADMVRHRTLMHHSILQQRNIHLQDTNQMFANPDCYIQEKYVKNKMKKEIENRDDIRLLVDLFYKKVIADKTIGIFFTEVIQLDWQKHIPVMYDFWESILLGTVSYKGNPMIKHIQLNALKKLEHTHFERWLKLWGETIDALFNGAKAEEAKKRATAIAQLMLLKISKPDFIHHN